MHPINKYHSNIAKVFYLYIDILNNRYQTATGRKRKARLEKYL